jgi:lipid-A-disaccharide synthase
VASELGVDKLEGPLNGFQIWSALGQEKTDCVLQLGGDLMFGRHIARRARAPLFSYAYAPKKGMEGARCFTAYPIMALKMPGVQVIGDLVRDALSLDVGATSWGQTGSRRLLLLPGSRPAIRRLSFVWLSTIVAQVKVLVPDVEIGTLFSPFMHDDEFADWRDGGLNPIRVGSGVAMKIADYALTQPGTNTLEMMHCGLPALVVAPMAFMKFIPLSGLRGMLSSLPLIGGVLHEQGIRRHLARYSGFMSWPNRVAGRMVMEEMYGDFSPQELSDSLAASLCDPDRRARLSRELLNLSGGEGAASRLADALESTA